jgi:hypothetical protein
MLRYSRDQFEVPYFDYYDTLDLLICRTSTSHIGSDVACMEAKISCLLLCHQKRSVSSGYNLIKKNTIRAHSVRICITSVNLWF